MGERDSLGDVSRLQAQLEALRAETDALRVALTEGISSSNLQA